MKKSIQKFGVVSVAIVLWFVVSVQSGYCELCRVELSTDNWSVVSWDCSHVPGSGDVVQIALLSEVTADSDISVSSIALEPDCTLNSGSYTIVFKIKIVKISNKLAINSKY